MSELTGKQKEFIEALPVNHWNGTRAAVAAGYSGKSAHVIACRLLKNPKISAELEKRMAELRANSEVTREIETERFRQISQEAEQAGQYSAAVRAEEQICKLHGLFEMDNRQKAATSLAVLLGMMLRDERKTVDSTACQAAQIPSGEKTDAETDKG